MKIDKHIMAGASCLLALALFAGQEEVRDKPEKPNILLILVDDLGYADIGVQGCTDFKTPSIDSIARNGIRFRQGYVSNSVCAPSRAGLLSGRIGIGFEANLPEGEHGLDTALETMADVLKRAGYATSCIGKWHVGKLDKYYPTNRGFDYFCGLRGGSRSYFHNPEKDDRPESNSRMEINGEQVAFDGYLTDWLTTKAIETIESQRQKDPAQPFFQYLSYTAPHVPMEAKPEHLELYGSIKNKKRRIYAAMMHSLDENIGRVLDYLKDSGQLENTMVVFLSDNGGPIYDNGSSNLPLRDGKGNLWEGGVRVPFLMQWPAVIRPGQVRDDMVSSLDLVPTFAALADVPPVENASGINLLPYLTTEGRTVDEQRELLWRRDHMTDLAMRSGEFKWIENRVRNETLLYNLETDVGEANNVAAEFPEIVERIRKRYSEWEQSVPPPAFTSGWTAADEAAKQAAIRAMRKQEQ